MSEQIFFPLGPNELTSAIITNVCAWLSTVALLCVILRVSWVIFRGCLNRGDRQCNTREAIFFRTRIGLYTGCLLIGNLFIGISGVLGISWLAERRMTQGAACTMQAILMSIGNALTAYFTVAVGVHTFSYLALRYRHSLWMGMPVIVIGWMFALIISLVPLSPSLEHGGLYGPDDITCGIQITFSKHLFIQHLVPIFLAALCSTILFSLTFLVLRGTLVLRGRIELQLDPNRRPGGIVGDFREYHLFIRAIAKSILWFLVAYVVLLLPYSVTRLFALSGFRVSTAVSTLAFSCWYILGFVNVLLVHNTFRILAPAFNLQDHGDEEGFGFPDKLPSPSSSFGNVHDPHHPFSPSHRAGLHSVSSSTPLVRHSPGQSEDYSSNDLASLERPMSPHAELDKQLADPVPALRSPARVLLGHSLPSATRPTRSSIVRHPTIESSIDPKMDAVVVRVQRTAHPTKPQRPFDRPLVNPHSPINSARGSLVSHHFQRLSAELHVVGWLAQPPRDGSKTPPGVVSQVDDLPLSAFGPETSFDLPSPGASSDNEVRADLPSPPPLAMIRLFPEVPALSIPASLRPSVSATVRRIPSRTLTFEAESSGRTHTRSNSTARCYF